MILRQDEIGEAFGVLFIMAFGVALLFGFLFFIACIFSIPAWPLHLVSEAKGWNFGIVRSTFATWGAVLLVVWTSAAIRGVRIAPLFSFTVAQKGDNPRPENELRPVPPPIPPPDTKH